MIADMVIEPLQNIILQREWMFVVRRRFDSINERYTFILGICSFYIISITMNPFISDRLKYVSHI